MKILAPLLSGGEDAPEYINAITAGADQIILLSVIDKEFMRKTSAAMSEVMHYHALMERVKKAVGAKRKKCEEATEWGATIQKITSLALLKQVDKIVFVKQRNQFFENILDELREKKIKFELVEVKEKTEEQK
ncbi:MAG: hypothetical protein NTZ73_00795 [Candidatus Diapherotrites archaeon]|nr:hypothetical protein [Candidatus Diapherotrites archaeon]